VTFPERFAQLILPYYVERMSTTKTLRMLGNTSITIRVGIYTHNTKSLGIISPQGLEHTQPNID